MEEGRWRREDGEGRMGRGSCEQNREIVPSLNLGKITSSAPYKKCKFFFNLIFFIFFYFLPNKEVRGVEKYLYVQMQMARFLIPYNHTHALAFRSEIQHVQPVVVLAVSQHLESYVLGQWGWGGGDKEGGEGRIGRYKGEGKGGGGGEKVDGNKKKGELPTESKSRRTNCTFTRAAAFTRASSSGEEDLYVIPPLGLQKRQVRK